MYGADGLFAKIAAYIDAKPRTSIVEVAARLRVDRHTVERAVREKAGKQFREWRDQILGSKSVAMLAHRPELSIKQVAWELGFRSPKSFTRFMRRTTGHAPCSFRQSGAAWRTIPEKSSGTRDI